MKDSLGSCLLSSEHVQFDVLATCQAVASGFSALVSSSQAKGSLVIPFFHRKPSTTLPGNNNSGVVTGKFDY